VNSWGYERIQEKKAIEHSSCNLSTQQPRAGDAVPARLTRNVENITAKSTSKNDVLVTGKASYQFFENVRLAACITGNGDGDGSTWV
jgi:hypothetical protein